MNLTTLEQTEHFWARVCFDRSFKPQGRYQVYRELVTERMLQVLKNICPVADSLLSAEQWWDLLWDFLRKTPPNSVILRDLADEFSVYLQRHSHPHRDWFPYLAELVHYEVLEVKVRFCQENIKPSTLDLLCLNPAHALTRYTWPVHCISETFHDPAKLPQGDYRFVLWRHPETQSVEFMEVNPLVFTLIEILATRPCDSQSALRQVAQIAEIECSADFLEEGKALLADLTQKRILNP